jgi:hypothetical protein
LGGYEVIVSPRAKNSADNNRAIEDEINVSKPGNHP